MSLNLKNLKYLKQGIYSITPLQLCQARITGYYGTIVGLLLGVTSIIIVKNWWWLVLMVFVLFLQILSLIGELQTKKNLIEAEQQINAITKAYAESETNKMECETK